MEMCALWNQHLMTLWNFKVGPSKACEKKVLKGAIRTRELWSQWLHHHRWFPLTLVKSWSHKQKLTFVSTTLTQEHTDTFLHSHFRSSLTICINQQLKVGNIGLVNLKMTNLEHYQCVNRLFFSGCGSAIPFTPVQSEDFPFLLFCLVFLHQVKFS